MKNDLVLDYLKEQLRYINSIDRYQGRIFVKDKRGEIHSMLSTYIYRLILWYCNSKETYASVFVIMDIFDAEYRMRNQYLIDDYLQQLRVKLSSL